MNSTFLDKIIEAKRRRLGQKGETISRAIAEQSVETRGKHRLRSALANREINIIAEFKRASPSKGVINDQADIAVVARQYEMGGAAAISVLTEEDYFGGSLDDLRVVRKTVDLPILRKDFIVEESQVYESANAGADAILLIVAALPESELISLLTIARDLSLDVIVEVHNEGEMETAITLGADIIGVNNRNLKTFDVSLDVSRRLIGRRPDGVLMISESGISTKDQIHELRQLGFDGFLIGESLMRNNEPDVELKRLRGYDKG